MSRTYRRKNSTHGYTMDLEYFTGEMIRHEGNIWCWSRVPYPRDSKEYRRGKARYHSDSATSSFKEPGPGWFRNLFYTRPLRSSVRNELSKWIKNPDYEVIADPIKYLPYWT